MALIAGNWKMNGLRASLDELGKLDRALRTENLAIDCVVCPPAPLVALALEIVRDGPVRLGGQDCHTQEKGAHTGDISAAMWADIGAKYVIVGHSERREAHAEDNALVAAKAAAVIAAGLTPIICIGETLAQREAGQTEPVLQQQTTESLAGLDISKIVLAYEPIWAIGTGLTPQDQEIADTHLMLKRTLAALGDQNIPILYGGSVNPKNAQAILALDNIDGVLVGGASLKADDFLSICRSC